MRTKYNEGKTKILKGWPSDRVTIRDETTLLLKCENGSWIKYALMELPENLLNDPDLPQMTKDMLHNKFLIQWTPDLEAPHYSNLGRYIGKGELPENEAMKEALKEFSFRVQLGAAFT